MAVADSTFNVPKGGTLDVDFTWPDCEGTIPDLVGYRAEAFGFVNCEGVEFSIKEASSRLTNIKMRSIFTERMETGTEAFFRIRVINPQHEGQAAQLIRLIIQ